MRPVNRKGRHSWATPECPCQSQSPDLLRSRRRSGWSGRSGVGPGSLLSAGQAGDTTCLCTADGVGNAVCLLQSIRTAFGSCVVAGGTGVLLNNRMTYWHLEADHPNVLAPGKRVRHTMNPVIATRAGRPVIVCGTPGADTQVQTNLQLLTGAVHFGMTPQEAVEAPHPFRRPLGRARERPVHPHRSRANGRCLSIDLMVFRIPE